MMKKDDVCQAVQFIAWGYILIYWDVNLCNLNILPDWLGYFLMLAALPILTEEVKSAGLLRPFGILLALWEIALWLVALLNISAESYLLTVLVTVVEIYFHFQMLTNLAELAEKRNCPGKKNILVLRTVNTLLTTFSMLAINWQEMAVLVYVMVFAQLATAVWICVVMFQLKRFLEET